MKARGKIKDILKKVNSIQDNVGDVKNYVLCDRDPEAFKKALNLLDDTFNTCIDILGEYDPID